MRSSRATPACAAPPTTRSVELERLHRARARAEDRIRAAKQTGLENLPSRALEHNAIWLELSLIAQDLTA